MTCTSSTNSISWVRRFSFQVDLRQVAAKEVLPGFLLCLEFRRWHDDPQTNDFVVHRDKPCPVKFLFVEDKGVILRGFTSHSAVADGTFYMRKKSDLFIVASNVFRSGHFLVGEEGRHSGTIQNHLRFDVLGCAIGVVHLPLRRTPPASVRNASFAVPRTSISVTLLPFLEHHCVEIASSHLPGRSWLQLPILVTSGHRDKPTAGPEDSDTMFNRIRPLRHLLLETEPTKQVARFARHGFSDMKAGEFLLFENDRLDAFSGEKHRRGRSTRPAADNQHISFHYDKEIFALRRVDRLWFCFAEQLTNHPGGRCRKQLPPQESKFWFFTGIALRLAE